MSRAALAPALAAAVDPAVRAVDLFAVHRALALTQLREPSLQHNAHWQIIRRDVAETFCAAFAEIGDA